MPTTSIRFEDIAPTRPDLEALAREAEELRAVLGSASEVKDCLVALRAWDGTRRAVETYQAKVELAFEQDTRSPEAKAAREAWDAERPRWTELVIGVKRALLEHPLRAALEAKLGRQAFALWESEVLAFDAAIKDDLVTESKLGNEYTELLASATLEFRGETLNLSTITKFRQHADRDVRHEGEARLWAWFAANQGELDRIFDDLVHLRDGMAKKLGFANFVELGYKRMCRVDYDQSAVERLRASIVADVVPLAAALVERQAEDLGLERILAWDEHVHDTRGNPVPGGDRAWMVERAQGMFDELGGGLGDFFRRMNAGGFLDLDARTGKAGGGFCTAFPSAGMPFVFANFNGTKGDVEVLTHEIGHAFQCYSSASLFPTDYLWPTYESAEVHSMSLEFLTWPHMEAFFGDDAERFRRAHLTDAVLFLPYGTAVDHFQHELYLRPELTPDERHALWREMEQTYLPWRDWGDLEYPGRGGRWQHQRHIYLAPFYYIDYVLAQTCALQMWMRSENDPEGALEAYVDLCKRGGKAPFQELVRSADLTSPFDVGALASVTEHARIVLDI